MAQRPAPSFLQIIQIHHLQALLKLGALPNPVTRQPDAPDPEAVLHEIALLEILRDRTEGNLDPEEASLLDEAIDGLRAAVESIS